MVGDVSEASQGAHPVEEESCVVPHVDRSGELARRNVLYLILALVVNVLVDLQLETLGVVDSHPRTVILHRMPTSCKAKIPVVDGWHCCP